MASQLVDSFARVARDRPDRTTVIALSEDRCLTSAGLWAEYEAVRAACVRAGLTSESLVVSVAGNRAGFLSLLLACLDLGVALMPVDRSTPLVEVLALADRWHASALVLLDPPALDRPRLTIALPNGTSLIPLSTLVPAPELYAGAAVLKLTSGSTGLPKATRTTEPHLVEDASHIVQAMDIRPDDVQLGAIPLSHAYGLGNLVLPLLTQGTAIVLRDGFTPSQVPSDAHEYQVRVFPGVPFMFEHLLAHVPADAWPASLTLLITAGARIDLETVRAFHARFGRKIHSFYGTSETGGIAYDASDAIGDRLTVGRPMPGVHITVRPDPDATPDATSDAMPDATAGVMSGAATNAAPTPPPAKPHPAHNRRAGDPGQPPRTGRIHVAGSAVADGYAGLPASEQEGFLDGGFLTGDLGRFDRSGQLLLTGRVSSFINVAGRKVQPDEVEGVLRAMSDLSEVKVIGVPDPRRGEVLAACLVSRDPRLRALDVRRFCALRLAAHKVPRVYVFLDEMPRDARGKTSRRALEEAVARELGDPA